MKTTKYICTECGQSFLAGPRAATSLTNHLRIKHGIQKGKAPNGSPESDRPELVTGFAEAFGFDVAAAATQNMTPEAHLDAAIGQIKTRTAALAMEISRLEGLQAELVLLDSQHGVLLEARKQLAEASPARDVAPKYSIEELSEKATT